MLQKGLRSGNDVDADSDDCSPSDQIRTAKVISYQCQKCNALCAGWAEDDAHQLSAVRA
jgi:hypothetical protein